MNGKDAINPAPGSSTAGHPQYCAVDSRLWERFRRSFAQVQALLDENWMLIQEINRNQESKIPQGLARNVTLIRQLNGNIARVVQVYADLSSDFVQSMAPAMASISSAGHTEDDDVQEINGAVHASLRKRSRSG